jgi:phage terminase small subunit
MKTKKKADRAPRDLGAPGRSLWSQLAKAYNLDDEHGRAVLLLACRAQDRAESCRAAIEADGGPSVKDRFGQTKPHPLLAAERDARAQVLQALRQLSLPIPTEE